MKIRSKSPLAVTNGGKSVGLPLGTIAYFSRLNRWRRKNGLKAYTWIHANPATREIIFGFIPKKEKKPC